MGEEDFKQKLDIKTINNRIKLPEGKVLPVFIISLVMFVGSGVWQFFC